MRISDWSSDVCSSDLTSMRGAPVQVPDEFNEFFGEIYGERWPQLLEALQKDDRQCARMNQHLGEEYINSLTESLLDTVPKIGRAPCRERVCQYVWSLVVAGSLKKKTKHIQN